MEYSWVQVSFIFCRLGVVAADVAASCYRWLGTKTRVYVSCVVNIFLEMKQLGFQASVPIRQALPLMSGLDISL